MVTITRQKINSHPDAPKDSLEVQAIVKRKLDQIDAEMKTGRRKWLTAEEALGKYAKNLRTHQ